MILQSFFLLDSELSINELLSSFFNELWLVLCIIFFLKQCFCIDLLTNSYSKVILNFKLCSTDAPHKNRNL